MTQSLFFAFKAVLFHILFVGLDHLLNHLTAYRTCLLRGEVAVVALLEVNAYFVGSLHLESVESFLCLGNYVLAA